MDPEDRRRRNSRAALIWADAVKVQVQRVDAAEQVLEELPRPPVAATVERSVLFNRLHSESHFFAVAAHNLFRALTALGLTDHDSFSGAVKTLRDCGEHWDEWDLTGNRRKGRAYRAFKGANPDIEPDLHRWGGRGRWMGDVHLDGVNELVDEIWPKLVKIAESDYVWTGKLPADL